MSDSNTESPRYAGFEPRLGSMLLDLIIWLPIIWFYHWGTIQWRLFQVYGFIPSLIFSLFYYVYLVRRFGGTPGKLLAGIRIRKLNGDNVGYRQAFLRFLPDFTFSILIPISLMGPLF